MSLPASRHLKKDASGTLGRRATGAANGCDSTKLFDEFELEDTCGGIASSLNVEGASGGEDHGEDHDKVHAVSTSSINGLRVTV